MLKLARDAWRRVTSIDKKHAALGLALIAAVFGFLFVIRQHVDRMAVGDEPHYLLMDYSLVYDHDLNLKNNYEHMDYLRDFPAFIDPHVSPLNLKDPSSPTWYSWHGIGVPLMVLPAYYLDEHIGSTEQHTSVVVFMLLVATAMIILTYHWSAKLTGNKRAGAGAAGLLAICYFFAGLAGYVYPDLITASLILAAFIILHSHFKNRWLQILFGALLGVLLFIHPKTLAIIIPFAALMFYRVWRAERQLPWGMIIGGLPFAATFAITLLHWFGTLNPSAIYQSNVIINTFQFIISLPASLLDKNHGLLVYNPVLLLLFVGLPIWFKKDRGSLLLVIAGLLPTILFTLDFNQWQGGYSPSGRYLMNFIPAFIPAVAFALSLVRRPIEKTAVAALVAITLTITIWMAAIKMPIPTSGTKPALFVSIQQTAGLSLDRFLPNFSADTRLLGNREWMKLAAGIAVVAACVYHGHVIAGQKTRSRATKQRTAQA